MRSGPNTGVAEQAGRLSPVSFRSAPSRHHRDGRQVVVAGVAFDLVRVGVARPPRPRAAGRSAGPRCAGDAAAALPPFGPFDLLIADGPRLDSACISSR